MLTVGFPGVDELRIQAPTARVVGRCPCGCPTIDLAVDDAAPLAAVPERVVEADVAGGEGGLVLFVAEGRLSGLEFWTVDDVTPAEFPPPVRILLG